MNKNASKIILTVTLIFGICVYLFFSAQVSKSLMVENSERISVQQSETFPKEDSKSIQNPTIVNSLNGSAIVEKIEVQQKVEKALHHIRNKSRLPTGALRVEPEYLQNHEAFEGSRWKILSKVKAVLRDQTSESDVVVGEMGRFQLVELTDSVASLNFYDRNSPVVVYETRLEKAGLVTGLIKVETERKDLLENALLSVNAQISNSFDSIQTYFVTSEQTVFDLEKLFFNIKSWGFVKTAELDILDREYEKK